MYNNVGEKIKKLAIFEMVVGSLAGIVYGFTLLNTDKVLGIIFIIVSPLVSWISSLITYGVGEIAHKVNLLYNQECGNNSSPLYNLKDSGPVFRDEESTYKTQKSTNLNQSNKTDNSNENDQLQKNAIEIEIDSHNEGFCPKCGAVLSFDSSFSAKTCQKCRTVVKPHKTNN